MIKGGRLNTSINLIADVLNIVMYHNILVLFTRVVRRGSNSKITMKGEYFRHMRPTDPAERYFICITDIVFIDVYSGSFRSAKFLGLNIEVGSPVLLPSEL